MSLDRAVHNSRSGPSPVCWHEAGHALVALVHEVPMQSVRANVSGSGSLRIAPEVLKNAEPDTLVLIAAAGEAAADVFATFGVPGSAEDKAVAYRATQRKVDRGDKVRWETYWPDAVSSASSCLSEWKEELGKLAEWICARHNRRIPWAEVQAAWATVKAEMDNHNLDDDGDDSCKRE